MKDALLTFFISFIAIGATALLINFCRRRLSKTPHGLSGMCHKDGGTICTSCREQMTSSKKRPRRQSGK